MGFPSDFFFGYYYYFFFRAAKKTKVTEEEGVYMAVFFTSIRSRGGEKEEL